jgi:hypothetical protein
MQVLINFFFSLLFFYLRLNYSPQPLFSDILRLCYFLNWKDQVLHTHIKVMLLYIFLQEIIHIAPSYTASACTQLFGDHMQYLVIYWASCFVSTSRRVKTVKKNIYIKTT